MSLPKPYYDHAGITIYNCDCREVLPFLGHFDLLLTDPPYGIGAAAGKSFGGGQRGHRKSHDPTRQWDEKRGCVHALTTARFHAKHQVIWGGQYFADVLPPSGKWLVWDKLQRLDQSDGELAWTSSGGALRIFGLNRIAVQVDGAVHPTQKPLALITWCINQFPGVQSVFAPFMGSGTTLVAAKPLGLRAVGIDLEREYCDMAVERLAQDCIPGMVGE